MVLGGNRFGSIQSRETGRLTAVLRKISAYETFSTFFLKILMEDSSHVDNRSGVMTFLFALQNEMSPYYL